MSIPNQLTKTTTIKSTQWRIQDFPEVGAPTSQGGGGRQHMILSKFPKICMKLKEYGPLVGGRIQNFTM